MCGIAGGMFWGGGIAAAQARASVEAMVSAVAHRGPDGRGIYASRTDGDGDSRPFAVLGQTRLAIIDLSEAGAQPMGSPGSAAWITFNGEIYNFAALRAELEGDGAAFRTRSDTETILCGYDTWGVDVVRHLRGMFAFAVWDDTRQRLFIARDRLGIKPLYWYKGDGFVLFASEVRALIASGLVPRRVDATALWQYLGYQSIPAPRTLVDRVSAMDPASWMTVSAGGEVASGTYWHMLDATRSPLDVSRVESRRLVGEKLRDAVSSHLVSDVPVGAFLSGGIDSSAVVALMRESGIQPRTFSVGFEERAFDESAHAALVARTFSAEHTHVPLCASELLAQLPDALHAMDQPTGDAINTYVVSSAVRQRGLKVALSGLGGDEVFGGYPSFSRLLRIADISRIWGKSPEALRRLAGTAVRTVAGGSVGVAKAAAILESDGDIPSMFPLLRQVLSVEQRRALAAPALLESVADQDDPYERLLSSAVARTPAASNFAQISFAEARTYMHDVLLRDTDQMSMAHALEVRVPLLDHELVELVTALPDAHKQSDTTPKSLLVDSLDDLLPAEIVHRPKQGFTLPFDPWMRGPLRGFCEERLGDCGLSGRGLMNPEAVSGLWRAFVAGDRSVSWSRLWVLVVLDAWLERNGMQA
jgi:asparagine synthase (glutamine-hydrolysing)